MKVAKSNTVIRSDTPVPRRQGVTQWAAANQKPLMTSLSQSEARVSGVGVSVYLLAGERERRGPGSRETLVSNSQHSDEETSGQKYSSIYQEQLYTSS